MTQYFFNLKTVYFAENYKYAFLDKNRFELAMPPKAVGDDLYVSIEDVRKVFAPYMTLELDYEDATVKYEGKCVQIAEGCFGVETDDYGEVMLSAPVVDIGGELCVPVMSFMSVVFGKKTESVKLGGRVKDGVRWDREESLVAVSNEADYKLDGAALTYINTVMNGKCEGELYESYWMEEADKIMPYSLYIPVDYDPAKKYRLAVCLHGGGLAEQAIYSISEGMIQFYTEINKYILLCPNAGPLHSTYGAIIPGYGKGVFPVVNPDDLVNPCGFTEEEIRVKKLGQLCVDRAIEVTKEKYSIDTDHMFLMGNSMGGMGTLWYASQNPTVFKAIAPAGGTLNDRYFDYGLLKGIHVRVIGGTEDGGFPNIKKGYKAMVDAGVDAQLIPVGGGVHGNSWARVLEGTFDFFNKY